MKNILFLVLIALSIFIFTSLSIVPSPELKEDTSLAEVLEQLGDKPLAKPDFSIKGVSAKKGEKLVLSGFAEEPSGGTTEKQSKHFVCTSCHNIKKEDPDLSVSDPQARLEYVAENGMPFLQGTTLYGAANRTSFYNGYYKKKYGDLVEKARNDIRESIQLCAVECAQGRALKSWEVESILAYLWTIDLKIKDLNLNKEELKQVKAAFVKKEKNSDLVKLLKSKYLQGSPATFVKPPEDRKEGYGLKGDPKNGKLIYELSCQHCHENQRYAFFELNNSDLTFRFMEKHASRYTRYSLYQVGRYGTYPLPGKRAYMPLYPAEKMSSQQMEDLRAYMKEQGENGNTLKK